MPEANHLASDGASVDASDMAAKHRSSLLILRTFGGFLMLVGLIFGVFGAWMLWSAYRIDWQQTHGTIIHVRIDRQTHQANDPSRRHDSYHPVVLYQYQVDGQSYTSDRYRLGSPANGFPDEGQATQAARIYRPQEQLTVYYDPAHPELAVMEPVNDWGVWVPAILGVAFLAGGVPFWFLKLPQPAS